MAQENPEAQRAVTVTGEGLVRVEPDMAVVRFGVVTRDPDPEAARRRNAEAARDAMNAVRQLGVEERRIRLETVRLQPVQEYDPETRRHIDRGFEAVRDVVVEVDDLEMLPELVALVVQRGANRLHGIAYDLRNRDQARNEALSQAVLSARDKARLLATTLDASIGRVMRINEQTFDFPRPMMRAAMEMDQAFKTEGVEPEAYAPGELEVRASVHVVFELQ
jgi:uncharacterized protein